MDRQTNGLRRAQREATQWLCDTVPSQSNPPHPHTGTHPSALIDSGIFFIAETEFQCEGIAFRGMEEGGQLLGVRG